ncbi:MAG TPA: hypothetical protein VKC34_02745 [Blastocatellia bacterium]|nr:hypothetical protein [Blastocatellia bacterium]
MRPIGVVRSPYTDTTQVPKGCGARHDAEGTLTLLTIGKSIVEIR